MLTPPVLRTPLSLGPLPHCNAPIRSQFSEVVESLLRRTHLLSTTPMLAFPWRLGPVVRLRASRAQRSRAQLMTYGDEATKGEARLGNGNSRSSH